MLGVIIEGFTESFRFREKLGLVFRLRQVIEAVVEVMEAGLNRRTQSIPGHNGRRFA